MNRAELLPLLWKNDIPLEMRMMLCKLADLGVEIDEGVHLVDNWASGTYGDRDEFWAGRIEGIYVNGELRGDIEEGDAVAVEEDGRVVRIGEVTVNVASHSVERVNRVRMSTTMHPDGRVDEENAYLLSEDGTDDVVIPPGAEVVSLEVNIGVGVNDAIAIYRMPNGSQITERYINPSSQQIRNLSALLERDA